MISVYTLSLLLAAYILGSIPTAVWVGQIFYKIDIREHGSGNAGASNTFRILGKKAGIPVMLIDIIKGFCATNLVYFVQIYQPNTVPYVNLQIALGVVAVVGHIFPIFAGFRGGKGIATLLGMALAIHTEAALLCILIFVTVLVLTKYVSLSSMLACFAFPFMIVFLFDVTIKSLVLFGVTIAVLVMITHQKNIERLFKGVESKANLFKKNKQELDE